LPENFLLTGRRRRVGGKKIGLKKKKQVSRKGGFERVRLFFCQYLVTKLTGLTGGERDSFMVKFRPTWAFTKTASDYEFQIYIKQSFSKYSENSSIKKNDE